MNFLWLLTPPYPGLINPEIARWEPTGIMVAMWASSSRAWWCVWGLEDTLTHSTTSSTCRHASGREADSGDSLVQQWSRAVRSTCFVYSTAPCSSNCRHLETQNSLGDIFWRILCVSRTKTTGLCGLFLYAHWKDFAADFLIRYGRISITKVMTRRIDLLGWKHG